MSGRAARRARHSGRPDQLDRTNETNLNWSYNRIKHNQEKAKRPIAKQKTGAQPYVNPWRRRVVPVRNPDHFFGGDLGGAYAIPTPRGFYDFFSCTNFYGGNRIMNIAVVHEDGTENEFDVELCCDGCAQKAYGWTKEQFSFVYSKADKGEALQIPNRVDSEVKFKQYVKSL